MLLKRHYVRDSKGEIVQPPKVSHLEVKHTGIAPEQNFSTRLVEALAALGFLSLSRGKIVLHAQPEDLNYTIKRGPGHYCCHCGEALPEAASIVSPGVTAGMKHVAEKHPGKPSPDASNPAGYMRLNEYECVLDTGQHGKYKAKSIGEARREAAQYFRDRQKKSGQAAAKAGV